MAAEVAVEQAKDNAQDDPYDIRYPVIDVSASVEAGLDEFNGAAEGRGADKDWQQPKAAGARQREG